jgi:hypothetical protein
MTSKLYFLGFNGDELAWDDLGIGAWWVWFLGAVSDPLEVCVEDVLSSKTGSM